MQSQHQERYLKLLEQRGLDVLEQGREACDNCRFPPSAKFSQDADVGEDESPKVCCELSSSDCFAEEDEMFEEQAECEQEECFEQEEHGGKQGPK